MERNTAEDRARRLIEKILSEEPNGKSRAELFRMMESYGHGLTKHCSNVAFISSQVCEIMNIPEEEKKEIVTGALFHDIGKIKVPVNILAKPGRLTPDEMNIVKRHPQYGVEILKGYGFSDTAMDIVLNHHETESTGGYPKEKIENIRIGTRIVSVVDKYDAITEDRPYSDGKNRYDAYLLFDTMRDIFTGFEDILEALYRCEGI